MRLDLFVQLNPSLCKHSALYAGEWLPSSYGSLIPDSQYKKQTTCNLILILLDKGREVLTEWQDSYNMFSRSNLGGD